MTKTEKLEAEVRRQKIYIDRYEKVVRRDTQTIMDLRREIEGLKRRVSKSSCTENQTCDSDLTQTQLGAFPITRSDGKAPILSGERMKVGNLKFEHDGKGGLKVSKLWNGQDDGVEFVQYLTAAELAELVPHISSALPKPAEEVKADEDAPAAETVSVTDDKSDDDTDTDTSSKTSKKKKGLW